MKERDREIGAGYDYQWDVATLIIIAYVIQERRLGLELDLDIDWLQTIATVHLEGNNKENPSLEDMNIISATGRQLSIQIKERSNDPGHTWRKNNDDVNKFLNRVGSLEPNDARRFVFLSNAEFQEDLRKLFASESELHLTHSLIKNKLIKKIKSSLKEKTKKAPSEADINAALSSALAPAEWFVKNGLTIWLIRESCGAHPYLH